MENLFTHILNVTGVCGVLYFSPDGSLKFKYYKNSLVGLEQKAWEGGSDLYSMIEPFSKYQEVELILNNLKIFIRKSDNGTILVVMDSDASVAMVRLNCDILIPKLAKQKKAKGFGSFFR